MSDFEKGYQANLKAMEYEKNKDIEKNINKIYNINKNKGGKYEN